jgi:hypothetical protein
MRAIMREILARRMPAPPEEFVAIQVSRLNEALLVAYSAMSGMNLKAVDRWCEDCASSIGAAVSARPGGDEPTRSHSTPRRTLAGRTRGILD